MSLRERGSMSEADSVSMNMRGRACFLIRCAEAYLTTLWPEKDWTAAAEHLWPWVSLDDWSAARELSDQVVPEFILAEPGYERTNANYGGKLPRELYDTLIRLYDGITDGDPEDEINLVVGSLGDLGNCCEGTSFREADRDVRLLSENVAGILKRRSVPIPLMPAGFAAEHPESERGGWGEPFDGRPYSLILKGSRAVPV